jgi:two-component system, NarL family, invasion response regulator UvrY
MPEIKRLRPQLPVLIVSLPANEQYAAHALKSGASGYLTKGCSANELIEALQTFAEKRIYLSASAAESQTGPVGSKPGEGTPVCLSVNTR